MARPRKNGSPARTPLTEKQALFLANLPHSSTVEEAAKRAGYPTSNEAIRRILKSPHVRAALLADMSAEGVNGRAIARYIRQGLDAKSYAVTKDGQVVELGPDWNARQKMLELVAKISGAMPDARMEITGADGGAIVVRHTPSLDGDD